MALAGRISCLVLGTAMLWSSEGVSRTWQVTPTYGLQTVLDQVLPGDTVELGPGIYREAVRTRRPGTAGLPITVQGPSTAILNGAEGASRVLEVNHAHYRFKGFTVDGLHGDPERRDGYRNKLVYLTGIEPGVGVRDVQFVGLRLRNAGGECLRIRYLASDIEVRDNVISNCGIHAFRFGAEGKNGEGIYIGTSSNQWFDGRNASGEPDRSTRIWVRGNAIDTQGNECIEVKEGSSLVRIEANRCSGQLDPASGGISLRGDLNTVRDNEIKNNRGVGIRVGGHRVAGVQYGLGNQIVNNVMEGNQAGGLKLLVAPQAAICGNALNSNGDKMVLGAGKSRVDPSRTCTPAIAAEPVRVQ